MGKNPAAKKKQDADFIATLRHSASHVMAQAVQQFYPGAKLTIGPSIEEGFYYDFDYDGTFSPDDFPKIEQRMREIIEKDQPFVREEISKEDAVSFFIERGEPYKVELLEDIADEQVTLYRHDDFIALLRGPPPPSTGGVRAFKLLSVAGAYWRGDERNKMLQRIYGTGFADESALDEHLNLLEEAKKRDHRRLGKELDLFQVNDEAGAGLG